LKRSTISLVIIGAGFYYAVVILVRGYLPSDYTPPPYFLVAPLAALVLVLVADLASRATIPSESPVRRVQRRLLSREVRFLTDQIETATHASPEYFDKVLRGRLRGILSEKVSLETGMDRERVRIILGNPVLGPSLLRDRQLYDLLYSRAFARRPDRVKMLGETVARVEAWRA
jgi:hypothetical protein